MDDNSVEVHRVDSDEEENKSLLDTPSTRRLLRFPGCGVAYPLVIGIVSTVLVTIIAGFHSNARHQSEPTWIPCGTTAVEARANNCHFDRMMRAWIPDACWFPEPADEPIYDVYNDREWFLDHNLTQPADMKIVMAGSEEYEVIYTKRVHKEHCLYTWRKLAISVAERKPFLDHRTHSLGHTTHCSTWLAKYFRGIWNETSVGQKKTVTEVPMSFLGCERLPWKV